MLATKRISLWLVLALKASAGLRMACLAAQANAFLAKVATEMAPYVGQGAYINYVDPLLVASGQWPQAYFGGNLNRLQAVKAR